MFLWKMNVAAMNCIVWQRICRCRRLLPMQSCVGVLLVNATDLTGWCNRFRAFHCSAQVLKKKIVKKPIVYSPKSKKSEVIIQVWRNMTVEQLAKALDKDVDHVFEAMVFIENTHQYDTPNAVINNVQVISEIVKKSGVRCAWISNPKEKLEEKANRDAICRPPPDAKFLVKRPPVVTIMGHVDHGKTTLLDSLQNTSVVSSEFGGITQHIGAFHGDAITFLDTPGHAAFMAMRARGANITDIVVLVVAADDGVMEQTVECIRLADQAKVPIIVAINKVDKPQADLAMCKRGLLQNGLQLEEFGGEVQAVAISALEGTNLDALVETIVTQAEMMSLKADPNGLVEGYVVESRTDTGRGKLSTSIVKRGTLRKGAFLVAGTAWAKVRAMFDDKGRPIQEAPPGTPVEVVGWRELPMAGDELLEVETERRANKVVEYRLQVDKEKKTDQERVIVLKKAEEHLKIYKEELAKRRAAGYVKSAPRKAPRQKEVIDDSFPKLNVVIKSDVNGSVEAILDVLDTYHSPKCQLNVIHYGVGMVTENDVELCAAFEGVVYTFNIGVLASANEVARKTGVPIKDFNVIYSLVEDIRTEVEQRLPMMDQDDILGEADVVQEFLINEGNRKIPVAGCRCSKGTLRKSALFRVTRGADVIMEKGAVESMRHLKSEVDSIKKDVECGIKLNDHGVRFQPGDKIICYQKIKVAQTIDWDPGF